MNDVQEYLALDDEALLAQCDVETYKASGPGGQHRNKTMSAVRVKHRSTDVLARSADFRSQHENRRRAVHRLRMNLALELRRPADPDAAPPAVVCEGLSAQKSCKEKRLKVSRTNRRFWPVAAYLLDVLEVRQGRLAEAADVVGVSTSNLVSVLKSERHLLAAAQGIRRAHGQKPIS